MKNRILIFSTLLFLFTSCHIGQCPSKEAMIESLAALNNNDNDAKVEWVKQDNVFYQIMNDCYSLYQKQLTNEDRRKIWTEALKYYTTRYEGRMDVALDEAKLKLKPEVQEDLKAFLKEYPNELAKLIGNKVEGAAKILGKFFDKFGKDLKQNMDDLEKNLNEEFDK